MSPFLCNSEFYWEKSGQEGIVQCKGDLKKRDIHMRLLVLTGVEKLNLTQSNTL